MQMFSILRIVLLLAYLRWITCNENWSGYSPRVQPDVYGRFDRTIYSNPLQGYNRYQNNYWSQNFLTQRPDINRKWEGVSATQDRDPRWDETHTQYNNYQNANKNGQPGRSEINFQPRRQRTRNDGWSKYRVNNNNYPLGQSSSQPEHLNLKLENLGQRDMESIQLNTHSTARAPNNNRNPPVTRDESTEQNVQESVVSDVTRVDYVISQDLSQITFISSNRTPEVINQTNWKTHKIQHVVQTRPEFSEKSQLFQASYHDRTNPSLGFAQTVVECYKHHHNLVLRPDDIWTAILVQLSLYINYNHTFFRNTFVRHQDKMKLSIELNGRLNTANYDEFVQKMQSKIDENLRNKISQWALPNFTTTTQEDVIINGIVLMSALQKYFDYEAYVACGIPQITLLGTVEDWKDISNRVKRLRRYGPEAIKWYNLLEPILEQFINAKEGNIDYNFWSDICRVHSKKGYLGQEEGFLDGWITAFSVFDNKGRWNGNVRPGNKWPKIELESWAPGSVYVPIKINNLGREYNATMFAGHMGQKVLENQKTMQPYSGWAIALD